MKIEKLVEIVMAGRKPVVRLNDCLWDESFGEKGMLAQVTAVQRDSDSEGWKFTFDYNSFREQNAPYMATDYFLGNELIARLGRKTGTAIECGIIKADDISEEIFTNATGDIPVELASEGNALLSEYVESGFTGSYAEWLENRVKDLEGGKQPQRQDSLMEQLRDLIPVATKMGCYDAADYLREALE